MGDMIDTFRAMREEKKAQKRERHTAALQLLEKHGTKFQTLSEHHLRIGPFDFWPSTGTFIERASGARGHGVTALLHQLRLETR